MDTNTFNQMIYDEYRLKLALKDKDIIEDVYFNTIPKIYQDKIQLRHIKYILEYDDDEDTKQLVLTMIQSKPKSKSKSKSK